MASGLLRSMPIDDLFDAQVLLDGRHTAHHGLGAFQEFPVVRGDVRLALRAVDDRGCRSGRRFLGDSFTAVGKPAPPRPTRPHALRRRHEAELRPSPPAAHRPGPASARRPALMTTAGTERRRWACARSSTASTVPDTPEWMSAPTKPPAAPTTVPTSTVSPFFTAGVHGAPDVLLHGQHDLFGQGHRLRWPATGRILFVRHARAVGAAFRVWLTSV